MWWQWHLRDCQHLISQFLQAWCSSWRPTYSVKALKADLFSYLKQCNIFMVLAMKKTCLECCFKYIFLFCKKSPVNFMQEMQIVCLHHMRRICYQRKRMMNARTGYELLNSFCTPSLAEVNVYVLVIFCCLPCYCCLPHAVNCRRFCFWRRQPVVFCFIWNISGTAERICTIFTRKICLVPRLDELEDQG